MEEGKIKVTINGVEHEWKANRSGPIQVSEGTIEVAGETWKASSIMPTTPEPEIDYDVEYDGIIFKRYGYNDLNQYLKTKPDASVTGEFIGFGSSKNDWVTDDLQWCSETNLPQEETEFYYEINSTVYFEGNAAFSFFIQNDDGLVDYYEFFVISSEIYEVVVWEWNSDGSLSDRWVTTSNRINLDGDEILYFYDYRTDLDWSGGTRYIPAKQPYK